MSTDPSHEHPDWSRYAVFLRKARLAAHQSLFFLYHVNDRSGADAASIDFALNQVGAIVQGIHVPRSYKEELPRALGNGTYAAPARDVIDGWIELRRALRKEWTAARLEHVHEVTDLVQTFLARSEPKRAFPWISGHDLANIRRYLAKNLSLILGILAALAASFGIEAIRSLLFNEGWYAAAMAMLVLTSSLVLVASNRFPRLGVGHRAFWAYRYQALEPERDLERWRSPQRPEPPERARWSLPNWHPTLPEKILLAAFGKALLVALWLILCGVAVASLGADTRLTVLAILGSLFLGIIAAHWIDRWDFLDPRPIRLIALGVCVLAVGTLMFEHRLVTMAILLASVAYCIWRLRQNQAPIGMIPVALLGLFWFSNAVSGHRSASPPWLHPAPAAAAEAAHEQPGVHVAARHWPFPSGGSRKGDPVVIVTASGGGSRAAIFTALALERLYSHEKFAPIANNIQAISSVSGGSLATAAYVARLYEARREQRPRADLDSLVRAVSQDFLWPTLVGALLPTTNRATEIERAWRDADGPALRKIKFSDLTREWSNAIAASEPHPPFPLPLFNTTSLDQHDVVLSPLPSEVYGGTKPDNLAWAREAYQLGERDALTWVYDRDAIYGLDQLVGDFDPGLAAAVRASANFPFGFPLVDVQTQRKLLFLDPTSDSAAANVIASLKLTDGGVLSNSGAWPLYNLLAGDPARLAELRERGVLLLVIEASKMPEFSADRRDILTLYGAIGNRAPIAQAFHRRLFELLNEKLQHQLAVVQLDMIPKCREESFNVHTTWALDDASQDKVRRSFDTAFGWLERETPPIGAAGSPQPRLLAYWDALREGRKPGIIDMRRPPVD